ncbi:MAG: succinate dehydrogenase, cytochrome b556 subunit [Rickettsiales bacterium]|nr:succinate dehydrogenase, cytochrome b556 subunit [Rickettsiales bacterium]|tara:strand:+ start:250 stop:621 length:372 start_codon:yes stop_codon:yes gene_type:complete
MNKENRPTSPHLTIYKPQITSLLSISHRITGIIQSFGLFLIFILILLIISEKETYKFIELFTQSLIGKIFFILYTFSLLYHTLNGIRHLIWDLGFGFDLKNVNYSGYSIIFLSIFLNFMLWTL